MNKQALLLDLDGTFLDTAPDMAAALNVLLLEEKRQPLPFAAIRPMVSHGSSGLIRLAFGAPEESERHRLQQRFLAIYRQALAVDTQLFAGFDAVVKKTQQLGMRFGVVTNKPGWLTTPLLAALNLPMELHCVVSGDTVPERKPHPLPLLHAAQMIAVEPAQCIYVGDAERDIQAARAAGMRSLIALWGYIGELDRPHEWRADGMVDRPEELVNWLS